MLRGGAAERLARRASRCLRGIVAGVPGITLDKPQSPLCVALLRRDAEWPDNVLSGCEVSNKRSALVGVTIPLGIVTKKSATFPERDFAGPH